MVNCPTCLKETDDGKLQQLLQITDNEPGNGRERKNHSGRAMKQNTQT